VDEWVGSIGRFHQQLLSTAFTRADPKSTKNTVKPAVFLGSVCVKAASKMLVKY